MKTPTAVSKNLKNRALQVQARLQELGSSNREAEETIQNNFVELGLLILEAEENKLWKDIPDSNGVPYKSIRKWMIGSVPFSLPYQQAARKAMKDLKGVPEKRLKEIPMVNLKNLIRMPESQRKSNKWIADAVALPGKEFTQKVNLLVMPKHDEPVHRTLVMSDIVVKAIAQAEKDLDGHGTFQQCIEHGLERYLQIRQPKRGRSKAA
jgi:hypothetical protein